MVTDNDQRKTVGAVVHSLAKSVRSDAECKRLFGNRLWNSTHLRGVVVDVGSELSLKGRRQAILTVHYDLPGDNTITRRMKLAQVKNGPPPANKETVHHPTIARKTSPVEESNSSDDEDSILGNDFVADHPSLDGTTVYDVSTASLQDEETGTLAPSLATQKESDDAEEEEEDVAIEAPGGMMWVHDDDFAKGIINGAVPLRQFTVTDIMGRKFYSGSDGSGTIPLLDYFTAVYPVKIVEECVRQTNKELLLHGKQTVDLGEMMKFIGVAILATRFEFGSRRELWSMRTVSRHIPAPCFGRTGMSRDRFDDIFTHLRFCSQPENCPTGMSSEDYRWLLVDGHVDAFNKHRATNFNPSDELCVDESISRWYGLGGFWINKGLPHYVAIDRKPENGCEIQNLADGQSGLMLQLKMVKSKNSEVVAPTHTDEAQTAKKELNHGTHVILVLVQPWMNKGLRAVHADSYYASVATARELYKRGMLFTGPVKTATKGFPVGYLDNIVLAKRGDCAALVAKKPSADSVEPNMVAFVWMDRNRRHFISTGFGVEYGESYFRRRWRQVAPVESGEDPELVDLEIPQPSAAEHYYSCCAAIDQHNRCRQDDLNMEKKLHTKTWHTRVNLSILAMGIVDAYLLYRLCTGSQMKQRDFYSLLADALIDNPFQRAVASTPATRGRNRESVSSVSSISTLGSCGLAEYCHLTPNREPKRRKKNGTLYKPQNRCGECNKSTVHECSACRDSGVSKPSARAFCHPITGRKCFQDHMQNAHF